MRRNFGGCAGNIAFNLGMLEGDGLPMATVGADFAPYAAWMDEQGIRRDGLREVSQSYTAQAYITTDQDDNQITAFHPGARNLAHECRVEEVAGVKIGMVSPDGRQGMIEHAQQFADLPNVSRSDFSSDAERRQWLEHINAIDPQAVLTEVQRLGVNWFCDSSST